MEKSWNFHTVQGLNQSTPLHFAARKGHLEIVKILLEYGADFTATNVYPNNDLKNTPVDLAAMNGHFEVVDSLLQFEYQHSNSSLDYRLNSISIAAGFGKLETLKLMLKDGYDVNDDKSWNKAQCGNFRIFLSLRFYVKSICRSSKTVAFATLDALKFVNLVK